MIHYFFPAERNPIVEIVPDGVYSLAVSAPGFEKSEIVKIETGGWRFVELSATDR